MNMKIEWSPGKIPPRRESTENELYGEGWNAWRKDGKSMLGSHWGGHGGGSIEFEIDDADFERLKTDFSLYDEIYRSYSLIHGDGWWADRNPGLRYVRVQPGPRVTRAGDFHITEEEFMALRKDHSLYQSLYDKYYDTIKSTFEWLEEARQKS
jgi:hypothetical protein